MSKRLKLGSDMALGEAARHSKTVLLDTVGIFGIDLLVGSHMLNVQPKKSQVADVLGKANMSALVTQVTHTLYLQIIRVMICFQKYVFVAEVEADHGQEPPHSLTGVIIPTEGIPDPQYQFSQWNSLICSHCACNSLRLSIRNRFHFNNHNITVIFFQSRSLLLLNSEHIKRQ